MLLIYPIWVVMGKRGKLQRMLPPLGVLSLASFLEKHGFEVHVVDMHAERMTPAQLRRLVQHLKPRHVGITVLSTHFYPANLAAQICKEEVNDCKVYVGGVHAEAYPEQMLANKAIDAVGRGDGEEILLELLQGRDWPEILGLSYRYKNKIVHNPVRPVNKNLDQYPLPAYHLINFNHYFPPLGTYKDLPAMNILMTRGCPGKCNFCNSANTLLRGRSVSDIIQLIQHLQHVYGIRQIYFYDDTFTANPMVVKEFCEEMIRRKIAVKWICYVRGDMFRDSLASLMSKAGCHQVLIGVESGSASLMAKIGKRIDKEKYKQVVEVAHKYGIEVRGSFIIGHPEETRQTMQETLDFAIAMNIDLFQLNIMTPYPGTMLFKELKEKGLLLHEDYSRYGQHEIVFKLQNLASQEVLQFEKYALFRFYFRPTIIWRQLKRLSNWNHVRDLVKGLGVLVWGQVAEWRGPSGELLEWLRADGVWIHENFELNQQKNRLTDQVRQGQEI